MVVSLYLQARKVVSRYFPKNQLILPVVVPKAIHGPGRCRIYGPLDTSLKSRVRGSVVRGRAVLRTGECNEELLLILSTVERLFTVFVTICHQRVCHHLL